MMYKTIFVVSLSVVMCLSACGHDTQPGTMGDVAGTVTDIRGRGLLGAAVTIDEKTVLTSDTGSYLIENVQSGQKALTVERVGYVPYTGFCDVAEGVTVQCEVQMTPNDTVVTVANVDIAVHVSPNNMGNIEKIDVIGNMDCNNDGIIGDLEPLSINNGIISFALTPLTADPIPAFTFTGYRVDFIPLESPNPATGEMFTPPSLAGFYESPLSPINPDVSIKFIKLVTSDTRFSFVTNTPSLGAFYDVRVIADIESETGDTASATAHAFVVLDDLDNCP